MTYFGFLALFLIPPLGWLTAAAVRDSQQNRALSASLQNWSPWMVLAAHVAVAVIYTTPWDNYLVATRVWWYDPSLVTGIVLGWVPVEEYTFFVLQTILTGLWIIYLARRVSAPSELASDHRHVRLVLMGITGLLWLGMAAILVVGWLPGTYLALELVWALPPIMLQLGFGADILWRHRRLVFLAIVPTTLYLSAADALAISSGTWTINPAQSLDVYIGGILPFEELLFFALTNTLVTFGMVLVLACQSQTRLQTLLGKHFGRRPLTFGNN